MLGAAFQREQAAAMQGDANAQFNLAIMYLNGAGVAQDEAQAVSWSRKAAEQGHEEAQQMLDALEVDPIECGG